MSIERPYSDMLAEISHKLDIIIGLLTVRSMDAQDLDAVFARLRDIMKLNPKVVARVVGITENAAAIRYSRMKRKRPQAKPEV